MTTLKREHVTPECLVSVELGKPCGAVLPETQHGAVATTPNGRLVSEDVIGRRTQSPSEPRGERRRASPTDTRMRVSRSPPSRDIGSPSAGAPRALPRSRLTGRLHGRSYVDGQNRPTQSGRRDEGGHYCMGCPESKSRWI